MSVIVSAGLIVLGFVLGELWRWLRDERGTFEVSYYREAAGFAVDEITEQRQRAETAMRRIAQAKRGSYDA